MKTYKVIGVFIEDHDMPYEMPKHIANVESNTADVAIERAKAELISNDYCIKTEVYASEGDGTMRLYATFIKQ